MGKYLDRRRTPDADEGAVPTLPHLVVLEEHKNKEKVRKREREYLLRFDSKGQ